MKNKIKFVANASRWFDKTNGNTYHSVNITRISDGKTIYCPFEYGYGEQYRYTAYFKMMENNWIPEKYHAKPGFNAHPELWERENNYPIMWNCTDGLKRDCISNGKE